MWIQINETLPNVDMAVLVWDGECATEAHLDTIQGGFIEHQTGQLVQASHWMNLPPGPRSGLSDQAVVMVPFDVFEELHFQTPAKAFEALGVHVEFKHRQPDHAPSFRLGNRWYVAKPGRIAQALIEVLRDAGMDATARNNGGSSPRL